MLAMDKLRLETFTDGVFAIVVTLLVLDLRLPAGTNAGNLANNLVHIIPSLATYGLSVIIIGMYWVSHHLAAQQFKIIDTRVMWLNILFILFVGLLPFTTSLLSEYMFSTPAIVIYGVNILAMNLVGWFIMLYLYAHPKLSEGSFTQKLFRAQSWQYFKVGLLYAIGMVFALVMPEVSIYVYALVTAYIVLGMLNNRFSWRSRV